LQLKSILFVKKSITHIAPDSVRLLFAAFVSTESATMDSALRPLWLSSLIFGSAPLAFLPNANLAFAYTLAVHLVFDVYCPYVAIAAHTKEIPNYLAKGDSQAATTSFVAAFFTLLTILISTLILSYVIKSGKGLTKFQEELASICTELGFSTEKRVKNYVDMFLFIFWPIFIYWSFKEVGLYGDFKEFYVNYEECFVFLARVFQVQLEEQFKIHVLIQKWIFEEINNKLQVNSH